MPDEPRDGVRPSDAEVRRRIVELREALRDTPPHSAAGGRAAIEDELTRLQRLLATRGRRTT